jgi:hypothetical protein
MTAAGWSRPLVLLVALFLAVALCVGALGRASAQTATTAPASTAAPAVSTTVPSAGDAASTRTVNRIVAVLAAFAVVLLGLAIWFWRATTPVPRHLDGLDMMGTRRWRQGGPAERSTLLAPVHERRGEEDGADQAAEPEPTPEPFVAADEAEDEADAEAEQEPTPRAS